MHLAHGRGLRIADCEIVASGRHGVMLEACEGEVTGTTVTGAEGAGIFSLDARGLKLAGNTIRGAGNNGILVWRSQAGDDGTLVVDNRIEDIAARAGGSGQNGNAINVFRAGNVIVRGNRIKGAAFSAVRGNAASNLQIVGNTCTGLGEVALYAEFGFEGALIANNVVDGAALGVAVTNFNEGGRLAVVQGNIIRNLVAFRAAGADPNDVAGVGIGVEADTAVTGNVVENAPTAGILLGWGRYLRDVSATGNVVRGCGVGIAVSVAAGAGIGADRRQSDLRRAPRRHPRHGRPHGRHRRARRRGAALRPAHHHRQPRALTALVLTHGWPAARTWPPEQPSIAEPRQGCEHSLHVTREAPMIYEFRTYTLHPRTCPSSSSAGCR